MRFRLSYGVIALAVAGAACTGGIDKPAASTVAPSPDVETSVVSHSNAPTTETGPADTELALQDVGGRAAHTATPLLGGELLVAGGCVIDGCGTATDATVLVSADGRSAMPGPTMSSPRDGHTATRVPDGRVVLVGGFAGEGRAPLRSIDVFDPATGSLVEAANLNLGRGGHAAATIGDGRVVITGGWVGPRTYTATTEIFDGATGKTTAGPDLPVAADALDVVTLADGRVLVTGGQVRSGVATSAAAILDASANTWTETGSMLTARFKHMSVLLDDGTVLVIGGTSDDQTLLATTEIFDPATGEFSPGPDLAEPRYKMQGGAVVTNDGRVVIAGGGRTVEVLDLTTGISEIIDTFEERGSFATITLLGSGDLLVLGGYDDRINLRRDVRLIKADDV